MIRKKGIPGMLVPSVISLYEGAKTRVKVDYELSEKFVIKVGYTKNLHCHLFFFAVRVDVVIELAKRVC